MLYQSNVVEFLHQNLFSNSLVCLCSSYYTNCQWVYLNPLSILQFQTVLGFLPLKNVLNLSEMFEYGVDYFDQNIFWYIKSDELIAVLIFLLIYFEFWKLTVC